MLKLATKLIALVKGLILPNVIIYRYPIRNTVTLLRSDTLRQLSPEIRS